MIYRKVKFVSLVVLWVMGGIFGSYWFGSIIQELYSPLVAAAVGWMLLMSYLGAFFHLIVYLGKRKLI